MKPISRKGALPFAAIALALLSMAPAQAKGPRTQVEGTGAQIPNAGTRYGTVEVEGLDIFYREAGPADAPVVLLLHGFPASSFMYRDLITKLSSRYRVIAPDYPGFGHSEAPSAQDFAYTFDRLAEVIEQFTDRLGLHRYALYMQDFGGPVGFRLAVRHPEKVTHLVIQNANAYKEGLPDSFWTPARALWANPSPENFAKIRDLATSDEALQWNYTHGVSDTAKVSPDSWLLQQALMDRPGAREAMTALLYDYRTNLDRYADWHRYFRDRRPPTLIVWGRNDVIFPAEGAHAYLKDLPHAELHLLDTGHFALEDKADEIARNMLKFLSRGTTKQ